MITPAMDAITQLFRLVDEYRRVRGVSDARVSTLVFNDGQRIEQLRAGSDIGSRRLDRALLWFSENWPADAEWPADVPRPASAEGAAA
jgi:hypothetical protein